MGYEVWFTYKGTRRFRVAANDQQRDDAVTYLESVDDVTDIDVIPDEAEGEPHSV